MKIEQLNSATDGHKEVAATVSATNSAYLVGNPAAVAYDSVMTGRYTPVKAGDWKRPDSTPMTRSDGYSAAGKGTEGCQCRH